MRFLHTADWHLGRGFHGHALLDAQAAFVDVLVDLAREEAVDAVLVAGDLYDRALPPAEAVELAGEALCRLADGGRRVVVIPGNHDSARRLGFAAGLLARAGVHVLADPAATGTPVLVEGVAVYGIPYLEPDTVRATLGCDGRTHDAVLRAALAPVRADLAGRPGTPSVVLAHAFVTGGATAPSERELAVGGVEQVGADAFAGLDLVALGHLHRPQAVGANARYAGSPLAFSFAEATDVKSVVVGEVRAPGAVELRTVACPVPRPLVRVRGELDVLLADPALREAEDAWVEATLTDPVRPADAMAQLRRRFPWAASLVFEPQGAGAVGGSYAARIEGRSDEEIVTGFVRHVRRTAATDAEAALLAEVLGAVRAAETAA